MKKIFSFLFAICCVVTLFFSCQKDFSVEVGNTLVGAGSLWDSNGNCLPDTVIGTFYNGVTPGSDTAYVEIQVNVTQTGSYNITTTPPLQNGFEFADSGFFSNTGINIIRLKPIGTPILNTPTTFTVSFDSSICSFTVNVQDSTGTGLGGQQDTTGQGGDPDSSANNWQFTQDTLVFTGTIDSATKDNSTGLATSLHLSGSTSTGDTTMSIEFVIPSTDIQTGTYTMLTNGIFFSMTDVPSLTVIYEADGLTTGTDFTVVITSYNSATKQVQGTFSGQVQDHFGNIVPITNGSFTALVN